MAPRLKCDYCGESIEPGERANNLGSDFHHECLFRGVGGSIAHLMRHCSCYCKGASEGDPPGLTRRQAAKLALAYKQGRVMVQFGIFDHPNDVPDAFVIRAFFICTEVSPEPIPGHAFTAKTLDDARRPCEHFGMHRLPRFEEDPQFLVETWI